MSPHGDTPPTDGFQLQSLAGQQPSAAPPGATAQMLRTARRSPQRRRPCPSPRRQRTEPSFRRMGWPSLCGVRRPGQWHTANSAIFNGLERRLDVLQDRHGAAVQTWGRTGQWGSVCCWSVVPGAGVCGGRPPPSKKKDFGHSGIFLNNTSPDPDASLPNPALQRLFDLCVFSSRANENAPANMEVLPSGLASSQHAHLVSASASASASASVRRHRPPLPLPPPPPPPPLGPQVPALCLLLGQSPASHVSSRLARLVPSGLFLLDGDAGSPNPTRCSSDDRRNV